MLWSLPAARALCRQHGRPCDFWTSSYCEPAADLLAAQEFIRHVVLDTGYQAQDTSCGVQPWLVLNMDRPQNGYRFHYHLGFRATPTVPLPEYCCTLYNLPQVPTFFDLPPAYEGRRLPTQDFVALAARGETDYRTLFRNFVTACCQRRVPVVEVGAPGQAVAADLGALDRTSRGFLEMGWVISGCRWFVGLLSAPYVVASGFPCVKILPHSHHWDMRHVVRTDRHHYLNTGWPVSPDPSPLMRLLQ